MMPELLLDNRYKLREALTALLKSHIKHVILFSDERDLTKIMNEVTCQAFLVSHPLLVLSRYDNWPD